MKRILLGTAVAIAAMLSACQSLEQPNVVSEIEGESVLFTATLGAETKTYIEYDEWSNVYKTKWSEGDGILILARQEDGSYEYESCTIVEGIGTTSAKFEGHQISDHYVAYYGYGWWNHEGDVQVNLQEYQGCKWDYNYEAGEYQFRDSFSDYQYHMYAVSDDTSFEFKNLCSVLKVSLTGTSAIDNVVFTPNDPSIAVAGRAAIQMDEYGTPDLVMANDSTARNRVIYQLGGLYLNEATPTNCYIVLPPMTYNGGFTITINSTTGSMTKVVNEDVTFERSQIRSLSPIVYQDENLSSWAIIGSMSNWSEDIPMEYDGERYYYLTDYYLSSEDEFKFRANADWATNFGGSWDYSPYVVTPDSIIGLVSGGSNLKVETSGTYNIIIDPVDATASFELVAPEVEPVACYSYEEIAALPDGTLVVATGHVFGVYKRGFIFNVGGVWYNCILVYQGTDQSMYQPVLGNQVNVYAYKTTYRGLPELYNVVAIEVADDTEYDYGYYSYWNLLTPQRFDSFYTTTYDYIIYSGTLEYTGAYWNVHVDGAEVKVGTIDYPVQDLTPFIGQKVVVEGWFIGFSGANSRYISTVLKDIYLAVNNGSTEDVVPGDDIILKSKAAAQLKLK